MNLILKKWKFFLDNLSLKFIENIIETDQKAYYSIYLKDMNCYLFFLQNTPTINEISYVQNFTDEKEITSYIIFDHSFECSVNRIDYNDSAIFVHYEESNDVSHFFCECKYCGKIGIQYLGRGDRIKCCEKNKKTMKYYSDKSYKLQQVFLKTKFLEA